MFSFAAKYPYLQVRNAGADGEKEQRDTVLDFGPVAVGKTVQKHFDIFNPSVVSSTQRCTNTNTHFL